MPRRQRHAVQLAGEEDIAGSQAPERQVLDEPVAGGPGKFPIVELVRPQIPCPRIDPEFVQEGREVGATPTHIGDATRRHHRLERIAAALMHRLHDLLGARPQLVEGQDAGAADKSVDDERPSRGGDARDAEMGGGENVVCHCDRNGHLVPELLDGGA